MWSDRIGALVARVVAASCARPPLVVALLAALTVLSVGYTQQHFRMNTDALALIPADVPWRRAQAAYDRAFPQFDDLIVVVVDGATPELAEQDAASLAAALATRGDRFVSVRRPDGGPFFAREGLLFLSRAEVEQTANQLIAAQPFLGPLAADPTLHGVAATLATVLLGVEHGETDLATLERPLAALAGALDAAVRDRRVFFSWREMIAGTKPGLRETRRFILVKPKLDNSKLMAAADATDAIRTTIRDLALDPQHGVRVRLTGSVVLADDEFATLAERLWLMTGVMIAGVLVMLWLALRSVRLIACVMATTLAGLALTTGLGLLLVGTFNVISVAFVPLFVGLGIDFAIQFSVRYRAERLLDPAIETALAAAGRKVGGALALAAAATAIGFFAFLPTDYVGASELGFIAGIGMIVAFLLAVTLLPALIRWVKPAGRAEGIGFPGLAPLDRLLATGRRPVLICSGALAIAALAVLPLLRFDFNPYHLRSAAVESVATLSDLMADPDRTPNTIDVVAPSLAAAGALAPRFAALPEVARVTTLDSFVPADQPPKLAAIADAATLLAPVVTPFQAKPPPRDADTIAQLGATAAALRRVAARATGAAAQTATRLAAVLDELATAPAAARDRATRTLIAPLHVLLGQIRDMLQAKPVALATLPPDLVRDWLTPDGRARIDIVPKGDSNDNTVLARFAQAVTALAPEATGPPVTTRAAARTIVRAFAAAGLWSFLAILVLLFVVLRRVRDVILTMTPIFLTGVMTLATCVVTGESLNFANIIALPLLFGVGVAFNIYFVMAWRAGEAKPLQSSLARAVLFSALTTGIAFGTLALSTHPGTAGTGRLLIISIGWTLAVALLFEPALLGPPRRASAAAACQAARARTGR